MKLNLRNMMRTGCFANILELKQFLIKHKKSGRVFYLLDISDLDMDEEFEFYFYLSKPPFSEKIAFPILRQVFEESISEVKLIRFFANYYNHDELPDNKELLCNLSVYKGSEWVWLYHNQKLEGF